MNPKEFVEYFTKFYGPGGLYPLEGWTDRMVELAIEMRGDNFEGDSIDREAIRDMILCCLNRKGGFLELP